MFVPFIGRRGTYDMFFALMRRGNVSGMSTTMIERINATVFRSWLFFVSVLTILALSICRLIQAVKNRKSFTAHVPILFSLLLFLPIVMFALLEVSLIELFFRGGILQGAWGYDIMVGLSYFFAITAIIMFAFTMHALRLKRKQNKSKCTK